MKYASAAIQVVFVLAVVIACGRHIIKPHPPATVVDRETIKSRVLVRVPTYDAHLLAELRRKGFQELGNCVQWVTITRADGTASDYLELSNASCPPANGLIADEARVARLQIRQHPTWFTQFRLHADDGTDLELGVLRRTESSGVPTFWFEALCQTAAGYTDEAFSRNHHCDYVLDGGRWANPAVVSE